MKKSITATLACALFVSWSAPAALASDNSMTATGTSSIITGMPGPNGKGGDASTLVTGIVVLVGGLAKAAPLLGGSPVPQDAIKAFEKTGTYKGLEAGCGQAKANQILLSIRSQWEPSKIQDKFLANDAKCSTAYQAMRAQLMQQAEQTIQVANTAGSDKGVSTQQGGKPAIIVQAGSGNGR